MILTDAIKASVEANGYVFINARRDIANVAIDEQEGTKVAVLYDWAEDLEFKKGDQMLSTFRCLMFVVEKAELNNNAEVIDNLVQRNRTQCKKILRDLRTGEGIEDVLSGSIGEVQNVFSSNYTGVDVEFRVKLREDDTEC